MDRPSFQQIVEILQQWSSDPPKLLTSSITYEPEIPILNLDEESSFSIYYFENSVK